jgi:ketosteroid isomerase-like protein
MSTERNKVTARQYVEEWMSGGPLDLVDELVAPDYINHGPSGTPGGGRHELKVLLATLRRGLSELTVSAEQIVAEGDLVTTRWVARGRHTGDLLGRPATGKEITTTAIVIDRYRDGKIVERWANQDDLGLLRQLGIVPGPRSSGRS